MSNNSNSSVNLSKKAAGGISGTTIAIVIFVLISISVGVYFGFFYKKNGSKCTPSKSDKVDDGDEYKYKDSKCVVSKCKTGYNLSKGLCTSDDS